MKRKWVLAALVLMTVGTLTVGGGSHGIGTDVLRVQANEETETKAEVGLKLTDVHSFSDFYLQLDRVEEATNIKGFEVNFKPFEKKDSSTATFSGGYYIDVKEGRIHLFNLRDKDLVTLRMNDGSSHYFKYMAEAEKGKRLQSVPADSFNENAVLRVRLTGSFESAAVNQRKYDAISGATGAATTNKNSNVIVEVAEAQDANSEVAEKDWKPLNQSDKLYLDRKEFKVVIEEETKKLDSGMKGVYSTYDSSITLDGIPKNAATYQVKVVVKDARGRAAESNALPFRVFDGNDTLEDSIKNANRKPANDGKGRFLWDMEPWFITKFGGDNETVVVPKEMKAWFGSHTSGTYGKLGNSTEDETQATEQKLIIPSGADVTLVNMLTKSSVTMIVQEGGKLSLNDSSVYGKIIVEKGGRFQMNYDPQERKYLTGAQINGQLILQDGAILDTSMIYSNANSLTDGAKAKRIEDSVVVANGRVTVTGDVFIRGDEAATGTSPTTQKAYAGQPALLIKDGMMDIAEGATLGVYGGGKKATTTHGGTALLLENGRVIGKGALIAVGGSGTFGDGGAAVSGQGRLSVAKAMLVGGHGYAGSEKGGAAREADVQVAKTTVGKAVNGETIKIMNENDQPLYWHMITARPNLLLVNYGTDLIDANGYTPGAEEQPQKPEPQKPEPTFKADWRRDKNGWWYEYAKGKWYASGWQMIDGKEYYFTEQGYLLVNQWINDTYYVNSNGEKVKNMNTPDGFQVDAAGKWLRGSWKQDGKKWIYRFTDGSSYRGGWKKIRNHWFFFDQNGYLAVSRWIENKYYVNHNGVMLTDTRTPDGYYVGKNGAWDSTKGRIRK
ncbi:MAG: hypothetical protein Q4D52_06300 [Eubacteriales bacterium]|nr:hypothetical protein [Eubacteriales bacterium]